MDKKPLIAITLGDPAGVGPELVVKAFAEGGLHEFCRPLVVGDAKRLRLAIEMSNWKLRVNPVSDVKLAKFCPGTVGIIDLANFPQNQVWGSASAEGGKASVEYIQTAADLAMSGVADAIVTTPINKKALWLAGFDWPGHTELLAEYTESSGVALMMLGKRLRVTLATLHVPLAEVINFLTQECVEQAIRLTHDWLIRYSSHPPNIAVIGLNPHCGDDGRFGNEENKIIAPAIKQMEEEGVDVRGPFSADAFFGRGTAYQFAAVVAMYHDQGLIPLKMEAKGEAVNVTLGIPILRVSVDHGTAYDIAGHNEADPKSLIVALKTATEYATPRILENEKT